MNTKNAKLISHKINQSDGLCEEPEKKRDGAPASNGGVRTGLAAITLEPIDQLVIRTSDEEATEQYAVLQAQVAFAGEKGRLQTLAHAFAEQAGWIGAKLKESSERLASTPRSIKMPRRFYLSPVDRRSAMVLNFCGVAFMVGGLANMTNWCVASLQSWIVAVLYSMPVIVAPVGVKLICERMGETCRNAIFWILGLLGASSIFSYFWAFCCQYTRPPVTPQDFLQGVAVMPWFVPMVQLGAQLVLECAVTTALFVSAAALKSLHDVDFPNPDYEAVEQEQLRLFSAWMGLTKQASDLKAQVQRVNHQQRVQEIRVKSHWKTLRLQLQAVEQKEKSKEEAGVRLAFAAEAAERAYAQLAELQSISPDSTTILNTYTK